ncbi:MAG: helix-turn-helix domain-containing protein [Eubacterium sp.]|nr:helix-turn-helix domain-containing protein [Eubacterium sp.]
MNKYNLLVGKKLEHCRKTIGITQEQMGKAIGLDNKKIHRYEHALTMIPINALYMYSIMFKIPMEDFANEDLSSEGFKKIYPKSHFAALKPKK